MSDHKFEKQVRQKLNNLTLTPSASAWVNIEDRLRGHRRRAPFLWLPLLLAGMVAGGYLISHSGKSTLVPKTTLIENKAIGMSPLATKQKIISHKIIEKKTANDPFVQTPDTPFLIKNNKRHILSTEDQTISASDINNLPAPLQAESDNDRAAELLPAGLPEIGGIQEIPVKMPVIAGEIPKININFGKGLLNNISSIVDKTGVPLKNVFILSKKSSGSKWSYAIDAYSGIVAVYDGRLASFHKPQVEDIAVTPSQTAIAGIYAPQYKPSTISPGLAFSVGAAVKRELSRRFSVSIGLNYLQLNTRSRVGERVNSSNVVNNGTRGYLYVQSYYRLDPTENAEYKNRYHFIEVPLTLHTRINSGEKLPVYWNAGVVMSRLLNSSSLHFDGTTGVYYKNDRLLNQTQAGVSTGFSFVLFNKTSYPLWIGPSARSNISTILKKDISASKHFVTLGLNVKLFLKNNVAQ